jgi:DUF4097 and DUF4098 domain-containing protein YvlB
MSFNEEKMLILKMLQEGKISSEEAAKLLEALDGTQRQSASENSAGRQQRPQANYYDEIAKFRERISEWKKDFSKNYSQKDFDRMVDDFSAKAEKVGKNVASATFGIVDKIADFVGSVVDTGSFSIFGGYAAVEKTFEAAAQEGIDFELEATNGQIVVKKHAEPNIIIKSKIRSPQNNTEGLLLFNSGENAVSLKLSKPEGLPISVSHEVFVPAVKFNKFKLETKNGKIVAEDTAANEFECTTKNAAIDLMGVTGDKVTVDTKNAKVALNYVIGKDISLNTKNALVDVKNLKVEKLGAYTANGRIIIENVQNYEDSPETTLELRTKNGEIKANMNDMEDKAYKIKARTTNGGINLLVPGLLYRNSPGQGNSWKNVDAESEGFSNAPQRVTIYAETCNGYIEIVK